MIYVMSDIHGDIRRYNPIMKKINLKSEDKLYVLGDVIDGMPYGIEILLELMQMKNVTVLLGNHEYMMLNAINNSHNSFLLQKWLLNKGSSTLTYFLQHSRATQEKITEYISQMPISIDLTINKIEYILVHAAPPELLKKKQLTTTNYTHFAVWTRLKPTDKIPKGKTVIFGHTPTECYQNGTPLHIWYGEDKIAMDCGSGNLHNACRLSCLRLDDMVELYLD